MAVLNQASGAAAPAERLHTSALALLAAVLVLVAMTIFRARSAVRERFAAARSGVRHRPRQCHRACGGADDELIPVPIFQFRKGGVLHEGVCLSRLGGARELGHSGPMPQFAQCDPESSPFLQGMEKRRSSVDGALFRHFGEAHRLLTDWRRKYNNDRPHRSLRQISRPRTRPRWQPAFLGTRPSTERASTGN